MIQQMPENLLRQLDPNYCQMERREDRDTTKNGDAELRMECLRLAAKTVTAWKAIELAEAYYRFVKQIESPDCSLNPNGERPSGRRIGE
jgi:hypothetical protein